MTITGTNLTGATAVTFGAAGRATGVSCTATFCTAMAPAGTVGTVDVQIATARDGTSSPNAADHYTFVATSTTTQPSPGSGSGSGSGSASCSTTTTTPVGPGAATTPTISRLALTGEQTTIPLAGGTSLLILALAACHLRRRAKR